MRVEALRNGGLQRSLAASEALRSQLTPYLYLSRRSILRSASQVISLSKSIVLSQRERDSSVSNVGEKARVVKAHEWYKGSVVGVR